jgi:hypothetical protein
MVHCSLLVAKLRRLRIISTSICGSSSFMVLSGLHSTAVVMPSFQVVCSEEVILAVSDFLSRGNSFKPGHSTILENNRLK